MIFGISTLVEKIWDERDGFNIVQVVVAIGKVGEDLAQKFQATKKDRRVSLEKPKLKK